MQRLFVHGQLVLMALAWGANWSFAKVVVAYMPPVSAAAARFLISAFLLMFWLIAVQGILPLKQLRVRQWLGMIIIGLVGVALYGVVFLQTTQYISASKGATSVALNPILPLLFGVWLFKERLTLVMVVGMLLAVMGALIAISQGQLGALMAGGMGRGEYLLFAITLLWTLYTLMTRALLTDVDVLLSTAVTVLFGALFLCVAAWYIDGAKLGQLLNAPVSAWFGVGFLALFGTVLAYWWYFNGIKALGVGKAAAYMALVPVFGIAIGTLWLGEPLHGSLLVGALMVVVGMVMMNLPKMHKS